MRIIKPGIINGDKIEQVTCNKCKCEFEFALAEATLVADLRDGNYLAVSCPTCRRQVTKAQT